MNDRTTQGPEDDGVSEAERQAWVDGELPPEALARVTRWLEGHPDAARQAHTDRVHRQRLSGLHREVLDESIPEALLAAARPPARGRRPSLWHRLAQGMPSLFPPAWVAAMLLAVVSGALGGAAGWWGHAHHMADAAGINGSGDSGGPRSASLPMAWVQQAAVAHAVFTPDPKRPVEIGADQEAQLTRWLTRRTGAEVRPPQLQALGWTLVGGRLLPGDSGPVAQLMYERSQGQPPERLTLYISRHRAPPADGAQDTAFRFVQQGDLHLFYWVDQGTGYALSAQVPRQTLARVATEVHAQLEGHATRAGTPR